MKKNLLTKLIYMLCGALCALPSVMGRLWILGWIAFVPVLVNEYMREKDEKRPYLKAYFRGFCFFYAYFLVIFYWFIELYPLDFAGLTPAAAIGVILLAWLGISLLQCIPASFVVVLLCFFSRKKLSLPLYPAFAGAAWICAEWAQTLTWLGVPWGKLALGQTEQLANVQSASLLGSYFVAFIMISVSGMIALSVIFLGKKEALRRAVLCLVCAIVIFEANSIYGYIALSCEREYSNTVKVAAIQANIASDEKWSNDGMMILEAHQQLTLDAAYESAELIVWPETALPFRLNELPWVKDYICQLSSQANAPIIVGCFHSENDLLYNSTEYVSPEDGFSETVYSKRRLVPFGEFVPLRQLIMTVFPPLAEISMLSRDIESGKDSNIFETEFGKIGSLICFDSIYESLARDSVSDGAELLAISTNDSWFHDSSAVYEHNAHAKLRSIENGRYTVRSANTGVSSVITDKGETVDMFPALKKGFAIGDVRFISETTLYTRVGNILIYASIAFLAITMAVSIIKDIKNGHNNR